MKDQQSSLQNKEEIFNKIQSYINENKVVLFMKGNAKFPQCGFSATVVNILQKYNVNFKDVNILLDNDIRQGIKEFSNWPTIPQLYIGCEFIGGCDIIEEMDNQGELASYFK